jgi:hypothetical protein
MLQLAKALSKAVTSDFAREVGRGALTVVLNVALRRLT